MRTKYLTLILAGLSLLNADYIDLRDGRRLEGLILEEKPEALTIEVGRNPEGTIRQVLIVHASEIRSWAADEARRTLEEDGAPVERMDPKEYVERLLRDAEQLVGRKEYDVAVVRFQEAADLAVKEVPGQTPEQRVEALELRAHALRLLGAALDGKLRHLDTLARGGEEDLRAERRRLEREWQELEADKERAERERAGTQVVELGRRFTRDNFKDRETDLRNQIARLNKTEGQSTEFRRQIEAEKVRAESQRNLNRERISQAETQAREARRLLLRRR